MPDTSPILLPIRVTAGAKIQSCGGRYQGPDRLDRLIVKVTTPPEGGKANKAVIALMAKRLGVPKSAITIENGATGRLKTLSIRGAEPSAVGALFEPS